MNTEATTPRLRSPWLYRVVLALPIIVMAYLAATGRLAAYLRPFFTGTFSTQEEFDASFRTGLLGGAAMLPLVLCASHVGRHHTRGRRLGYDLFVGLREVARHALGRTSPPDVRAEEFARAPSDNPRRALALGAAGGIIFPLFFLAFLPMLRTGPGIVWLAGAGAIMGALTYCRRRASAYIIDEPGRFDMFRELRLLNTARCAPGGHHFVRVQRVGMVLLPIWWLVGGPLAMGW